MSEIERFFNEKLIFAVNTPNEKELNPILKEEVGKNPKINLNDTEFQFHYILNQMVVRSFLVRQLKLAIIY